MSSPPTYAFGRFEVLPARRQLLVDGGAVAIGGRALDLLLALIEHRDRMLTKDELLDRVWPDAAVEPNNLAVQIGALRKLLGPDAIATIPGRGYRFSVALDGLPWAASQPAAATPNARPRTNLPETPTAMIGRADDSAALQALLDRHALVTITGAGGIGKSLLAQHLLHRRREAYPHGVCWVELAAVGEPGGLAGAVAAALGVQLGGADPAAALCSALAPLGILVALDNAEHLLDAVAGLATSLADAAPMLRLVVTSQAPLHVAREQVYRLDALAVPPVPTAAAHALGYGAVALFVERARAADARFVFDDGNAAAVIELCRRLDGLPLAIELAAARAPLLGVQRIAETLGERLQLLTGGRRDAPARQQTLRAALDWSHGLLSAGERTVFRRLAVISGSASLEVIQRIAADDDDTVAAEPERLDKWSVVDALGRLIDRSLVAIGPESDARDRPRYRLLDSPRAYAEERLRDAGESERMARRHARAVGDLLAAAWEDRFSGRIGIDAWRRSIQPDRDNARTALAWAMARQDLPLLFQMGPVLLLRGTLGGSSHAERVALAEALDALLASAPPALAQLRIRLSLVIFWHDANPQRGLAGARFAMELARQADDRFAMYVLLSLTARVAMRVGEPALAAASLAEMHAIEDPSWPPHRRYWGPEAEGFCAVIGGGDSSGKSLPFFHKTLELAHAAGDSAFAGRANLVAAELAAGNAAAAAEAGRELVALLQQTRDEFTLAVARANLLAALLAQDDLVAARPVAEAGWAKAATFGLQPYYGDDLALMAALQGRSAVAAQLAGYATAAYATQQSPRWQIEARAFERATAMSRSALGSAEFERLMESGASLADAQIADIMFE